MSDHAAKIEGECAKTVDISQSSTLFIEFGMWNSNGIKNS